MIIGLKYRWHIWGFFGFLFCFGGLFPNTNTWARWFGLRSTPLVPGSVLIFPLIFASLRYGSGLPRP